jgi:hypothetical protein
VLFRSALFGRTAFAASGTTARTGPAIWVALGLLDEAAAEEDAATFADALGRAEQVLKTVLPEGNPAGDAAREELARILRQEGLPAQQSALARLTGMLHEYTGALALAAANVPVEEPDALGRSIGINLFLEASRYVEVSGNNLHISPDLPAMDSVELLPALIRFWEPEERPVVVRSLLNRFWSEPETVLSIVEALARIDDHALIRELMLDIAAILPEYRARFEGAEKPEIRHAMLWGNYLAALDGWTQPHDLHLHAAAEKAILNLYARRLELSDQDRALLLSLHLNDTHHLTPAVLGDIVPPAQAGALADQLSRSANPLRSARALMAARSAGGATASAVLEGQLRLLEHYAGVPEYLSRNRITVEYGYDRHTIAAAIPLYFDWLAMKREPVLEDDAIRNGSRISVETIKELLRAG